MALPPSEIWLALPAVTVPSLSNAGRSPPRLSTVVPGRTPSSCSTTIGSPLRCGQRHGDDLVGEAAVLDGVGGPLVRRGGELVLRLAADRAGGVALGAEAHQAGVEGAPQAVGDDRVAQLGVAVAEAGAGAAARYGALVIDSMPPATTMSASPAAIIWSAR